MTWHEARQFCEWLETKLRSATDASGPIFDALRGDRDNTQWQVSLPSDVEWRWAAAAATSRRYPWGDDIDELRANFRSGPAAERYRPSAVGTYPRGISALGLMDMGGNVAEWTRMAAIGPQGAAVDTAFTTIDQDRALSVLVRGGSFQSDAAALEVCASEFAPAEMADRARGFRVVIAPLAAMARAGQDTLASDNALSARNAAKVGPTTAPPPQATDPTALARKDIQQVLEEYRKAYEGLDLKGIQRNYPTAPTASLKRGFDSYKSLKYAFEGPPEFVDVDPSRGVATVKAKALLTPEPTVGSQKPYLREETFSLENRNGIWIIRDNKSVPLNPTPGVTDPTAPRTAERPIEAIPKVDMPPAMTLAERKTIEAVLTAYGRAISKMDRAALLAVYPSAPREVLDALVRKESGVQSYSLVIVPTRIRYSGPIRVEVECTFFYNFVSASGSLTARRQDRQVILEQRGELWYVVNDQRR